jgi:hypothetical protein
VVASGQLDAPALRNGLQAVALLAGSQIGAAMMAQWGAAPHLARLLAGEQDEAAVLMAALALQNMAAWPHLHAGLLEGKLSPPR